MKRFTGLTVLAMGLIAAPSVMADDVYVEGYFRDDGTYVEPHIRSSPDNSIRNNYGPSQNDFERLNPRTRDYDNDGTSNYLDYDSDNDGFGDEWDGDPYNSSNSLFE